MALVRESRVEQLRPQPVLTPAVPPAPSARRPARRPAPASVRRPAARWSSTAVRWLWGGVALAIGLFIAGGGVLAWAAVAATTLVGVVALACGRRWAPTALWVGVGLCLGVCLHLTLELTAAERSGLLTIVA